MPNWGAAGPYGRPSARGPGHGPALRSPVAFLAIVAAVTVAWELRRGSLGFGRSLAVGLVAGLPAVLLALWLDGDGELFTLPLWAALALLLPGLPYAIADTRGRKRTAPGVGQDLSD